MGNFKLVLLTLICVPLPVIAEPMDVPPDTVTRIMAAYEMSSDSLSLFAQAVDEDTPLVAVNSNIPRNPASTIKLLTTLMALEELGPVYTWKTEAYLEGEFEDGTLDGDLLLKGYGDPYMVVERYWMLLRRMNKLGLQRIAGDLVIDNTFFDIPSRDTGAFDGQGNRVYNVAPDALLVNFQAISFTFLPNPQDSTVMIIADPMPANLKIQNRLRLTGGYCGGFQNGIVFALSNQPDKDVVTFSGSYRSGCPEYRLSRSVLHAPTYAYGVFRTLWQDMGAELGGGLRAGTAVEDAEPFLSVDSPPLAVIIRNINKWSNNVMARHVLLTMGVERFGPPATIDKAREAATMFLTENELAFPGLEIDNGAGLSRTARISASHLGELLLAGYRSDYSAEFISSLPLAGLDGTLRRRFKDEDLTGRMHLKTGRLTGVFSMAGYVRSESGRDYVVVAIQNHPDAHRGPGEEMQSEFLRWVYRQ